MTFILLAGSELFMVPIVFIFVAVIFIFVFAAAKAKNSSNASQNNSTVVKQPTDSSGRTQHQREYLQELRTRQQQRKPKQESTHTHVGNTIVSNDDGHSHVGEEEERYDEIVGSLGDTSDEGCADLDGVRLIAHDIAYETEDGSRDYSEVAKVVVLGDVINNPRFKNRYRIK